jgi:ectoine hydroxylase-related dioxygenase (phytanoyl-CoA dioxygenase family)
MRSALPVSISAMSTATSTQQSRSEWPPSRILNSDYPLTREQILSYRRDGFIQLNDLFTGPDLRRLREAVAGQVAKEHDFTRAPDNSYSQIFIQRVNLWERNAVIAEYVTCKRLGNLAARLAGKPMRLWHDHALFKEPRTGSKTPWHQDAHYWPHDPRGDQLSCWIALQDATIRNGCMSFIPGSHTVHTIEPINLGDPQDIFELAPQFKGTKPRTCELRAGSVTFHNGLTFHYAGPNKTDQMREAIAILYMPDGTRLTAKSHVCTDDLGLKPGDVLDQKRFPLVSDVVPEV